MKTYINILTHKDGNKLGKRKRDKMIALILSRAFYTNVSIYKPIKGLK